ncbi:hypothetical protein L2E82_37871 [Cichorium intybus]|uniref:Uncharacterized protein n=1 Tax=Cichorium intybus TaxID=13427 RepID=A0ACB9AG66_CICIN|nr:hypothetical protein L2E82_37871 [Cichorium intybus]
MVSQSHVYTVESQVTIDAPLPQSSSAMTSPNAGNPVFRLIHIGPLVSFTSFLLQRHHFTLYWYTTVPTSSHSVPITEEIRRNDDL